jgi:hypothetical protein
MLLYRLANGTKTTLAPQVAVTHARHGPAVLVANRQIHEPALLQNSRSDQRRLEHHRDLAYQKIKKKIRKLNMACNFFLILKKA